MLELQGKNGFIAISKVVAAVLGTASNGPIDKNKTEVKIIANSYLSFQQYLQMFHLLLNKQV